MPVTGQLVLIETETPSLSAPNELLIEVKTVGICGSEVHAFEGTHPYRKAPVILGHEAAGVVREIGQGVTGFRPGDRVIIDPQWTCGECVYCRSGDINLCPNKRVMGTPVWPGAFGEYVIAPQESVFPLPDSLSFVQGCLIEPLTVCVHVARRADLKAGEKVAVLGAGSIGGLLCGVSRALGATEVIAADIHHHCLDAARECLGASHDLLLPDADLVGKVLDISNGGVDIAFVTADDPALVQQAIKMVKRRGRVVLVALLTEGQTPLWAYDLISGEKHLLGSSMSTHDDVREAIRLAESGLVNVAGIHTHTLPITDAAYGMELASSKAENAIKVLLTFEDKGGTD